MQCCAEIIEALCGVGKHHLWGLKAASWAEFPAKTLRVDSYQQASGVKRIHLSLDEEISAVDKGATYCFTLTIVRPWAGQNNKGILLC